MTNPGSDIKLSIGMPMFRDDASSNFAVESALAQPDAISEIIISDNNLQRSSEPVRRWSRDARVRYINSGQNIGASGNFIRCWEEASERYFLWLGDDDFLHPSFGRSILNQIQKSNDNAIAWSSLPSIHFKDRGALISGRRFQSIDATSPAQRLRQVHRLGTWNYFFYSVYDRQKISIDNFKYFNDHWKSFSLNLDYAWTYAVSISGLISLVPEQLYFYCYDNWENPAEWNRRDTRIFSAFLNPSISESDSHLLRILNGDLLNIFFVLRHCQLVDPANLTAPAGGIPSRRPHPSQDLADAMSGVCFYRLRKVLADSNSTIARHIRNIFGKRSGKEFLSDLVDLLNSKLQEQYSIASVASEIMNRAGDTQLTINALNRCKQIGRRPTIVSLLRSFADAACKPALAREGFSFAGRWISTKKRTRKIYLPLQD